VRLPGRPPSWNDSYHIVRKYTYRNGQKHYFHTLAKTEQLVAWQEDMVLIVRAAKPSGWAPTGWVRTLWDVQLERHIDMDNLQKAVNDVLEMATGVNDKWFVPSFKYPEIGVSRRDAGITLTLIPCDPHGDDRRVKEASGGSQDLADDDAGQAP
jgi:hypothetical protein